MSKQDRQGVRTASDIERKYDLSQLKKLDASSKHQNEQLSKINQAMSQFFVEVNAQIEDMQNKVSKMHSVGSIHIGVDDTNPATLFGGEWELIAEGHFLVGLNQESEDDLHELLQTLDTCYVWKRTA